MEGWCVACSFVTPSVVWGPAQSASPGSLSGPNLDLTNPNLHLVRPLSDLYA